MTETCNELTPRQVTNRAAETDRHHKIDKGKGLLASAD